jgi:hypothetical protein
LAKQALPQQTTDIFERLVDAKKLIEAATLGDLEKVTILLQQFPEMISGPAWDLDHSYPEHPGWTRAATLRNDYDVAKLLLDFGAVPDHGADSMGNPIEHAMQHGFDRIVSLLYAAGGTCGIRMYAMLHRIDVVAEMLNQDPSLANSVLPGGWKGEPNEEQAYDIMRLAIRHGARFEDQGSWSLRWTLRRHPTVYRLLQDHGADLDCKDKDGLTPLAVAARQGSDKVVEYLLEAGAATTTQGPDWTQPLALAKHHDHGAVIDLLVR